MPHVEIPQAEFKVVILGDSHIGKTSLVTRFAEGYYRENSRPATIGAFFVTKRIQSTENIPTKIQIWDTAGAESFRAMAPMFYKNAAAVVVCYDVTRRESFEGMREWLDEVRQKVKVGEEVVVAIAALKTDLLQEDEDGNMSHAVPEHEVEQLAEALGVIYLPTSAKTNMNVQALFQCVTDRVLQSRKNANLHNGEVDGDGIMGDSSGMMDSSNHHTDNMDCSRSNTAPTDDIIQMASPRKRDQFDKYYISKISTTSENNDSHHTRDTSATTDNDEPTPLNNTSRGSSNHGGRKKSRSNINNMAATHSTDGTMATEEGDHPLLAPNKDKKSKRKEKGLCTEESFLSCQSVSCGAGDGGLSCIVQ